VKLSERLWWLPALIFAAWLFAIAFAFVEIGFAAGVVVWLGIPIALVAALYTADELRRRRARVWYERRAARRRHPAGSAGESRTWG